jgi:hypothetical protein
MSSTAFDSNGHRPFLMNEPLTKLLCKALHKEARVSSAAPQASKSLKITISAAPKKEPEILEESGTLLIRQTQQMSAPMNLNSISLSWMRSFRCIGSRFPDSVDQTTVDFLLDTYKDMFSTIFNQLATDVPSVSTKRVSRGTALRFAHLSLKENFNPGKTAFIFDKYLPSPLMDSWGLGIQDFSSFMCEALYTPDFEGFLSKNLEISWKFHESSFNFVELLRNVVFEPEVVLWLEAYKPLLDELNRMYFACHADNMNDIIDAWIKFCKEWEIVPFILTTQEAVDILKSTTGVVPNTAKKLMSKKSTFNFIEIDQKKSHKLTTAARLQSLVQAALAYSASNIFTQHSSPFLPEPDSHCRFGVTALGETLVKLPFYYLMLYGNVFQARLNTTGKLAWLVAFLKDKFDKKISNTLPKDSDNITKDLFDVSFPFRSGDSLDWICPNCKRSLESSLGWGCFDCHQCNPMLRYPFELEDFNATRLIWTNLEKGIRLNTYLPKKIQSAEDVVI